MGLYGRTFNIRLSAPLARRMDELREAIPGLPMSILHRSIMRSVLELPLEERVRIVQRQLRRPPLED